MTFGIAGPKRQAHISMTAVRDAGCWSKITKDAASRRKTAEREGQLKDFDQQPS